MSRSTNIIICGDLCPTEDTRECFDNQNNDSLFNDIIPIFENADFVLGNLEFVLTDSPKPITKAGPILHGKTSYIKTLKAAGIDAMSLANNHIKDCGEEGVLSTINACKENNVDFFGAGKNINEAKKPYIKEVNGYKIGFISYAEQEFNTATQNEYGANYFDPFNDLDAMAYFSKQVDYLIILYHGGIEYYEYPSPLLQKKCRKFIEKGADLVTCQHSHCIGTFEYYNEGKILYGQGNTLFGYRVGNVSWNRGLLIKLIFEDKKTKPEIEFIPIHATKKGIERIDNIKSRELLEKLHNESLKIKCPDFIQSNWVKFCSTKKSLYLSYLFGFSLNIIRLNRLFKNLLFSFFYSNRAIITSHNLIRCESHNEVIQSLLDELDTK